MSSPRDLAPYAADLARRWRERFGEQRSATLTGTLVKVDLSGFTRLSERLARTERTGAEEVNAVVDALWTQLIQQVLAQAGDVLQFGGDALVVWFEGQDHALRGAAAAWAMREAVRRRPAEQTPAGPVRLRLSAGATSGSFAMGLVGTDHLELVVYGPDATSALRCESLAPPGQVAVSELLAEALTARGAPVRWSAEVDDEAAGHGAPPAAGRWAVLAAAPPRVEPVPVEPADGPAAAFLDPQVLELERAGPPLGEHRRATVAFVQLFGLDERVVQDGRAATHAEVERVAQAVERAAAHYGVCWLATDLAPDGVVFLLVAGAPRASEQDEERVLRLAADVLDECPDLPLRAGVHCGRAFAADVGHPRRRTYAVLGDTTNTAARLMGGAEPGQVRVSREVWSRSDRDHDVAWVGDLVVRGRRQPVEVGVLGRRTADTQSTTHDLPLLGRTDEARVLAELVDGLAEGRGGAALLLGPAGQGKSRLVADAASRARAAGLTAVVAAAAPYESSSPYGAVRSAVRSLLELDGVDDADRVQALAAGSTGLAPLLALPLGAELPPTSEVAALDPAFVGRQRAELLADVLLTRAPLLLVLEDVHLSDRATLELLDVLAGRTAEPLALLLSGRSLPDGWPASPERWRVLDLPPLDRTAARQLALASAASSGRDLDDLQLDRLLDEAAGNPLFLQELVAWSGTEDTGTVPDGVEQVISARIDLLPPGDRALLRQAAVLGTDVDRSLAAELLADDSLVEASCWSGLDAFLELAGSTHRFRHDLYRRVAYDGLAVRRRRTLHRATAEHLAQRPDPDPAALAQHLHAAQQWEQAWAWSLSAARAARANGVLGDALDLTQVALDAGRRALVAPPALAEAEELLGDVADLLGRYALAEQAYLRAGRAGEPAARTARTVRRAAVVERQGRYRFALSLLTRAERSAADELLRAALLRRSSTLHRCGRLEESAAAARRVVELAGDAPLDRARALLRLEMVASELGLPDRFEVGAQAAAAFAGLDEPRELGNLHVNLGVTAYESDDWDAAVEHYRRSDEAYRRAGDRVGAAFALNNAAEIRCEQGHLDAAREDFEQARRIFRAAGLAFGAAGSDSALGRVAARSGDLEAARALLGSAHERLAALGSATFAADAQLRLVEVDLLGRAPQALAQAQAWITARHAGSAFLDLTAHRYLAVAHAQAGDPEEAGRLLLATLDQARSAQAAHETGLCLDHLDDLGRLDAAGRAERDALWARLGVVHSPTYHLTSV